MRLYCAKRIISSLSNIKYVEIFAIYVNVSIFLKQLFDNCLKRELLTLLIYNVNDETFCYLFKPCRTSSFLKVVLHKSLAEVKQEIESHTESYSFYKAYVVVFLLLF